MAPTFASRIFAWAILVERVNRAKVDRLAPSAAARISVRIIRVARIKHVMLVQLIVARIVRVIAGFMRLRVRKDQDKPAHPSNTDVVEQ